VSTPTSFVSTTDKGSVFISGPVGFDSSTGGSTFGDSTSGFDFLAPKSIPLK
jgi:hypothetical protein